MMSRYRVTDQYGPYSGLSQKCTGSSRRRRAKKPCQVSSEYRYGLLTSISSSGTDQGSRCASALKSIPLRTGATISFIGLSCGYSCAGLRTIIERDVRSMKIGLAFSTCQRQRSAPLLQTGLSMVLEERADLRGPLGWILEGGPVPAVRSCRWPEVSVPYAEDVRERKSSGSRSGAKREAAAGAAKHQFLRHLLAGEVDEVLPTTVHRQDMLQVELLQLGHDLAQIVVRRRR